MSIIQKELINKINLYITMILKNLTGVYKNNKYIILLSGNLYFNTPFLTTSLEFWVEKIAMFC